MVWPASANIWSRAAVIAEPRRGAMIECLARSAAVTLAAAWGATGRERGDRLRRGSAARTASLAGGLAGQEAEGRVELVGGEAVEHVGGDALAEADLDARVSSG